MMNTPGPWNNVTGLSAVGNFEIQAYGVAIGCIYTPTWGGNVPKSYEEAVSNLHLALAAPDMLALLKKLKSDFDAGYYVVNDKGNKHKRNMEQIEIVLNKAWGTK